MSDVFISYASEDHAMAATLVRAFEQHGLSVWWDSEVVPGQRFDEEIQRALASVKCVVVLWSKWSVDKRWVREEADEGAERGCLVPILIDEVRIPLGFRRFHAGRLIGWDGDPSHPGFARVVNGIRAAIGEAAGRPDKARRHSPLAWRRRTLLLLSLPAVAALVSIGMLHIWRMPTHIEAELTTERVEFTVGAAPVPVELMQAVPFQYLAFDKFASVRLEPGALDAAVPRVPASGASPPAWLPLRVGSPLLRFLPRDLRLSYRIIFEKAGIAETGTLDALWASPGTSVTLEAGDQTRALRVQLQGDAPRARVALSQPLQFVTEHLRTEGVAARPDTPAQVVAYRGRLREDSPLIAVEGTNELSISLRVPEGTADVFAGSEVPVTAIRFVRLARDGALVSTLIGEGTIGYPAYPGVAKRSFRAPAFLGLDGLERFSLREIRLDPQRPGVVLRMEGIATHAMTSSGGIARDYRLTLLEMLCHSSTAWLMLAVAAWMLPITIGAWRVWRELQR